LDYTFVNCEQTACPAFVAGFPTLVRDGQILVGYQAL
jgi:hypothetical protein